MNAAIREGRSVAIFSLEMSAENIIRNMLCALAAVPGQKMRRGGKFIGQTDRARLQEAAGPLFDARIFVDDSASLTPTMLRSKARRIKAKDGLDLIVVDYMQLMDARGGVRGIENRQQEISYISRSLKGLARELEVPVIALSQLNRDAEKREGNRPKLSDLRESGAIEQDADVICLLYRPWYYTRKDNEKLEAEVIIAKQRNGPTGTVRLYFHDEFMRFDNPAPQGMA
jgi:replicative DNA helicase